MRQKTQIGARQSLGGDLFRWILALALVMTSTQPVVHAAPTEHRQAKAFEQNSAQRRQNYAELLGVDLGSFSNIFFRNNSFSFFLFGRGFAEICPECQNGIKLERYLEALAAHTLAMLWFTKQGFWPGVQQEMAAIRSPLLFLASHLQIMNLTQERQTEILSGLMAKAFKVSIDLIPFETMGEMERLRSLEAEFLNQIPSSSALDSLTFETRLERFWSRLGFTTGGGVFFAMAAALLWLAYTFPYNSRYGRFDWIDVIPGAAFSLLALVTTVCGGVILCSNSKDFVPLIRDFSLISNSVQKCAEILRGRRGVLR